MQTEGDAHVDVHGRSGSAVPNRADSVVNRDSSTKTLRHRPVRHRLGKYRISLARSSRVQDLFGCLRAHEDLVRPIKSCGNCGDIIESPFGSLLAQTTGEIRRRTRHGAPQRNIAYRTLISRTSGVQAQQSSSLDRNAIVFGQFESAPMAPIRKESRPRERRAGLQIWQRLWRPLTDYLRDPYRPERHYMRGPGPKYLARHSTRSDKE
jgi:hypothetical protein